MRILGKLAWVELKLLVREPVTVVFTLLMPVVILFVLGEVFGSTPDPEGVVWRGLRPIDFYTPAYVGLVMVSIGVLALPVHLASYREHGVLRRFRASSVPSWALVGAQVAVSLAIATASAGVLVAAASWRYGITFPHSFAGVVGAFLLCGIAFASLGVLLGAVLPTARAAQGIGMILFFVMMLLGGAGPPREVMTDAIDAVAGLLPLTYATTVLQGPWLDLGLDLPALAVVASMLFIAAVGSVSILRRQ